MPAQVAHETSQPDHAFVLYAERMAHNGLAGLRAVQQPFAIIPELLVDADEERLRDGLDELRSLMVRLYERMGADPLAFGIPPVSDAAATDAPQRRRTRAPFEAPFKALYVLGRAGQLARDSGGLELRLTRPALVREGTPLGLRDPVRALESLARAGLDVRYPGPDGCDFETCQAVAIRTKRESMLIPALQLFARVSGIWERARLRARRLPDVFMLADFRALGCLDARAGLPALNTPEVLPFLAPGEAAPLARLAGYATGLGYRMELVRESLLDGEWRATFVGEAHGRTLMAYDVARGKLALRLRFDDIGRVIPDVMACPARLRRELLGQRCVRCGGAGCGRAVKVALDGEDVLLCHFGTLRIDGWKPEDCEPVERLMKAMDDHHIQGMANRRKPMGGEHGAVRSEPS